MNKRQRRKIDLSRQFGSFVMLHLYTLLASLGRIWRSGLGAVMTTSVIAIALALPSVFLLAVDNLEGATRSGRSLGEVTVFARDGVADQTLSALASDLQALALVETVRVMSADQALAEFSQLSGFSEALDALEDNPLPAVAIVSPVTSALEEAQIRSLIEQIERHESVAFAQYDLDWMNRLAAIVRVIGRGIEVVGVLFALAVLLVVGNTIRLDILNRREEIMVSKLIGATDAFVRRPFLYTGFWYGFLGGLLAWLLLLIALSLLSGPVDDLAASYGESFELDGAGIVYGVQLISVSALLGWLGSGLAVRRHLREIEPT